MAAFGSSRGNCATRTETSSSNDVEAVGSKFANYDREVEGDAPGQPFGPGIRPIAYEPSDFAARVFGFPDELRKFGTDEGASMRAKMFSGKFGVVTIATVWLLSSVAAAEDGVCAPGPEDCPPTPVDAISPAAAPVKTYIPMTGRERWEIYARRAFWSPGAAFRALGPALGAHLNNEPPEWGQGLAGFSRRSANRFGRFALQETYEAAGAALLRHDVRYFPSADTGFLRRAAHALTSNFVTYDRQGRRVPHLARLGSAFAAEFTGNLWMPPGRGGASEALRGVGLRLGIGSAFNLLREFSPELRRLFLRKSEGTRR
jgi:hypothetical protein